MPKPVTAILNFASESILFSEKPRFDPETNEMIIPIEIIRHRASTTEPIGIRKDEIRIPAPQLIIGAYANRRS